MRTTSTFRAGLLGLAAASALALTGAPAHATPTAPALPVTGAAPQIAVVPVATTEAASTRPPAQAAAKKWRTIQHKSKYLRGPARFTDTKEWKRKKGVRVVQVNARCWGNDARLSITLRYKRGLPNPGWPIAKSGKFPCNGRYHTVRIHNAGHSKYYGQLTLSRDHTVEWWFQYYG
ncbi:hypothetical protein [Actinomadura kijaniata]|uniref:hypothetical protein n=1 Tax=Actinomadura kijaniata TaxID=46161 RepID=UPI00082DB113|nr:hypothetical protein [Actinomadura kijaniata]